MSTTTVILARHGRTPWHDGNRYTGSSDIGLDDVGGQQARHLARWTAAHPPDALFASDLLRAQQTAAAVTEATGLTVVTDPRLRELDFGLAEGRTLDEIREDHPGAVDRFEADAAAYPLPGGEDPAAAALRGCQAVDDLVVRHPGATVLVIAHSTLIRLIVCRYLGIALRGYRTVLNRPEPASITRIVVKDGAPMLDAYNVAPVVDAADRDATNEETTSVHRT